VTGIEQTAWKRGAVVVYWELAGGNTEPMNQSGRDGAGKRAGEECCQASVFWTRGEGKRGRAFTDHTRRSSGWNKAPRSTSYILDPQCAEMEWQDLWGIESAGTRLKEMEEVIMGVLVSRRTSIMKKATKEILP